MKSFAKIQARVAAAGILAGVLAQAAPAKAQFLSPDLYVDKVEVTQSTQYLDHATEPDNSLLGIDRRATTVRVYVGRSGLWLGGNPSVQARLQVHQGSTLKYDILADNGPISLPATLDRDNENHTLNFTFMPEGGLVLFGRTLTFTVTVDPFDTVSETNEGNNTHVSSKFFACRRTPSIVGMPIDYQAASETDLSTLGEPDPNLIQQTVGDAFVWRIYPFPDYEEGANGRYRIVNAPAMLWTSNVDSSYSSLLSALETYRLGMSPVPDYIYGWLRGNPFWGNGVASINGNSAFGNTDPTRHQRTFAHELGHNFGYYHYHAGSYVEETGWDTLDQVGLGYVKDSGLYDIMVPGLLTHQAWIHPETYQDTYDNRTSTCMWILEPVRLFAIVGLFEEPWRRWQFEPPIGLTSRMVPLEPQKEGRGYVRLLDGEGGELYASAFTVEAFVDGKGETEEHGFVVVVPQLDEATYIELYGDGELRAEFKRSEAAPELKILSPRPGEQIDRELVVAWDGADKDSSSLVATVRYSADGGETFVPLSMRAERKLVFATDPLPASRNGLIEVSLNDGFNTTVATVGDLTVGTNQNPEVTITRPAKGQVFAPGANVLLLADGRDAEDGNLSGSQLQWSSDVNGALGEGNAVNVSNLKIGQHLISVVATDSAGARSRDSVEIQVR